MPFSQSPSADFPHNAQNDFLPPEIPQTDVAIVGAGPAGLFAVFQLGLLGLHTHVFDPLPRVGGQCAQLYGDKLIYDIAAVAACTGEELGQRLADQMRPFAPTLHLAQRVQTVVPECVYGQPRWRVRGEHGSEVVARALVIAAGVGAFVPRTLKLDGEAALAARGQLHYHASDLTRLNLAGRAVLVSGGGEDAVQAALQARQLGARSVMLVHRRTVFEAAAQELAALASPAPYAIQTLAAQAQSIVFSPENSENLQGFIFQSADGQTLHVPADIALVYQGLSPKLGPLADWGVALAKKHVPVDAATFCARMENMPQAAENSNNFPIAPLHAIGDICTYAGKRKLLVSAFHEAALAALAIADHFAGSAQPLQYTSSSAQLQARLGVL